MFTLQFELASETGVIHGAVHSGWYEALFYPLTTEPSIFQNICTALVQELSDNEKKLFITGHSMGMQSITQSNYVLSHICAVT